MSYTLHLSELKRFDCYNKLRELIHEKDLSECSSLINKINDVRHNKVKARQKAKFDRLYTKVIGYMYNGGIYSSFGRNKSLSGHRFLPGHFIHNNTRDRSTFQNSTTLTAAIARATMMSTTTNQDVSTNTTTKTTTSANHNTWVINLTSIPLLKCRRPCWPGDTILP